MNVVAIKILTLSSINTSQVSMELRHLNYFLMVAAELSFIKASKKLFISQPPLSRQIKELENELGVQLFNRNNKKVALTEAGKYFEKEIKHLLENLERVKLKTSKIDNSPGGEFRIGYISSTFSGDISALIKYLSEAYPYVNFRLYELPTANQISDLEQEKLDLGIIRAPIRSPHLNAALWFRGSYSIVFNKNNVELKSEKDIKKLEAETFVFFNNNYAPEYYNRLVEICAHYGFIPKVVHEANNVSSIIQMVKNGLGASILPSNLQETNQAPELGWLAVDESKFSTDVLLATAKNNESAITKSAVSFLREHFEK